MAPSNLRRTDEDADIIAAVQQIAARVLGMSAEEREPLLEPGTATADDPMWFKSQCLLVASLTRDVAVALGLRVELVLGDYIVDWPRVVRHAWLETDQQTIIDPTSEQLADMPPIAVVPLNDPRRSRYLATGWPYDDETAWPRWRASLAWRSSRHPTPRGHLGPHGDRHERPLTRLGRRCRVTAPPK